MLQIMASKILFVFGAFICFAALVTSDNYTELEISSKTTQKTIWQGSQTFHRMIIGMTDIDFGPNGKASAHLKTLRSFASRFAGFLGVAGAFMSIILEFTGDEKVQDSPELKLMKTEFGKLSEKIDIISKSVDDVKSLIKMQAHKRAYLHDELKINNGYDSFKVCINELQNVSCSGKEECRKLKVEIGMKYINALNVEQNARNIYRGTLNDGVFGSSLLSLLKERSKCDRPKLITFENRVSSLYVKGQIVALLHDLLKNKDYNYWEKINRTTEDLSDLGSKRQKIEEFCLNDIGYWIRGDISRLNKKFTSNTTETNRIVHEILFAKYPWIEWLVCTYKGDKTSIAWPKDSFRSKLFSTSEERNIHTFAIPTDNGKVTDYAGKLIAWQNVIENMDPDEFKGDLSTSVQKIERIISKPAKLKGQIQSFAILRGSEFCTGYYIYLANQSQYLQQYMLTSIADSLNINNMILHTHPKHRHDYAFVVTFNTDEIKCSKLCSNGTCKFLPLSNEMICRCPRGLSGDRCQYSDNDVKQQIAMMAVIKSPIELPSFPSIQHTLDDAQLLIEMSMPNIEKGILSMEANILNELRKLHYDMETKFDLNMLEHRYGESIENLLYFQILTNWTYIRQSELTSKFKSKSSATNAEKEEVARYLLNPLGIQHWLDHMNFLIMGRNEDILDSHRSAIHMVMDTLKHRACFADYKATIDRTAQQLSLLQRQGYFMWIHAYSLMNLNSMPILDRLTSVLRKQRRFLKESTCRVNLPNSNLQNCSGYIHHSQNVSAICNEGYFLSGK